MSTQSIYDMILDNMTLEGKLPEGFSLPLEDTAADVLRFMPGARDGILGFQRSSEFSETDAEKIVQLLKSDWRTGDNRERDGISEILHMYGTLSLIDPILHSIQKDHEDVDIRHMVVYAGDLAFRTADEELVKLGIGLLGLINLDQAPEIMDQLLVLAVYEEFTLYADVAVSGCTDGNDLLFSIAQKVDGWGKIYTVERLDPSSEEIRDWLLRKGCTNAVMDAYLGLECAEKGNLIGALRRDSLDGELFNGIGVIIEALLDEGPAKGISVYEHAEEALGRYLQFAADYAVTADHLLHVLSVQEWLKGAETAGREELLQLCGSIVNRSSWRERIRGILGDPDDPQFFCAYRAAAMMQMDVSELIFKAAGQNPVKCTSYLSSVYQNPEYAEQMTKICEETLPLGDLAAGMGKELFPKNLPEEHMCLEMVLQELKNYPNMGETLVQTALRSPVIRERNFACRVLKQWSLQLGMPVQTVSPNLFSVLAETAAVEVNPDTQKNMEEILSGE